MKTNMLTPWVKYGLWSGIIAVLLFGLPIIAYSKWYYPHAVPMAFCGLLVFSFIDGCFETIYFSAKIEKNYIMYFFFTGIPVIRAAALSLVLFPILGMDGIFISIIICAIYLAGMHLVITTLVQKPQS
ncbi:MAG: hypothetical protein EXS50_01550 [Candidatus Taylorbacteria bacterium]|nr:hypothetical protein [Candidatus Taylorbacteria bacterium]